MALIHCHFFSDVLGLASTMDVILPQATERRIGMAGAGGGDRVPTLWLLHGLSDDHTIWQRRTSIERYAAPLGLAVVMPAVGRSWYTDMAAGPRGWTFVSEELPAIARGFFPLDPAREANVVAGLSMGGYGAMKLALTHPDRYAAAASLSGALDMAWRVRQEATDGMRDELERVFGDLDAVAGSDADLLALADRAAASGGPVPRLYQWCGTEDFLYESNVRFRDHVRGRGLDLTYEEGPGGHEWGCWDGQIQRVLAWAGLGVAGGPP